MNITRFDFTAFEEQLLVIPSGEIELRDDRNKQKWSVKIDSFLLSNLQFTQQFYFDITNQNPSHFIAPTNPVENVSWKDAILFCNKLSEKAQLNSCYSVSKNDERISFDKHANGFRLPTEAEWQFACQAGTKEIRYGELDKIAWVKSNAQNSTQGVGIKEPNAFGLYDMLGNVWEWCNDIYDETVYLEAAAGATRKEA